LFFCHEDTKAQGFFVHKVTNYYFTQVLADLADYFPISMEKSANLRETKKRKEKDLCALVPSWQYS
jgi:uncharacterized membrane protein required for colicin V production